MAVDTSGLIFVGVNVANTKGNRELRSQVMKEHYRRKRELIKKCVLMSSDKQSKTSDVPSLALRQVTGPPTRRQHHTGTDANDTVIEAKSSSERCGLPTDASITTVSTSSSPSYKSEDQTSVVDRSRQCLKNDCLQMAIWQTMSGMQTIFSDPISEITASVDLNAQKHFRRYFIMPNALLDLTADTLTCKVYNIPLAMRFPILIHVFAAYSCGTEISMTSTSRSDSSRHHLDIVRAVNKAIVKVDASNYNTILLGVQGAMASAFSRRDEAEFAVHRRGQASFLRTHGPPSDPDVTVHVVSNSLMYGDLVIGSLLNHTNRSPFDSVEFQRSAFSLMTMLLGIHQAITDTGPKVLLTRRCQAQRRLLSNGSTLHSLLHPQADDSNSKLVFRRQLDVAHFPFLLLYLVLLFDDLDCLPDHVQEDIYGAITSDLRASGITSFSATATANWMMLVKFKHNTERAWRAYQFTQVLLRLDVAARRAMTDMLVYFLCPSDVLPALTSKDITGSLTDALCGL